MNRLNWGILSTASINRRVIPEIQASSRSQLVAVASRNLSNAKEYAGKWQIPQAFGSYEELLASPEINAVYIPLPNTLHKEWAIKAMQAGKHVLCEKPLALHVEDVKEMIAVAHEQKVMLMEAFMYQFHPQMKKMRSLIDQGSLGEVQFIKAHFSFFLGNVNNIRLCPELGGGSLWDVGCYPVSFAQTIIGNVPVEVKGFQRLGDTGVDTIFSGQLRFENGAIAQIDSSVVMPHRVGAEIVGTKGLIRISHPWTPDLDGKRGQVFFVGMDGAETQIIIEEKNPYQCEIEAFECAVLDQVMPEYTHHHSLMNVATINQLYRSANEVR